jgi:hypothetical protein
MNPRDTAPARLTEPQGFLFEIILDGTRRAIPPGLREMCAIMGYPDGTSGVRGHLEALKRKGLVRNLGGSRGHVTARPAAEYGVVNLGDGRIEVFRAVKILIP